MKHSGPLAFALLGIIWGTNFIFMKWAAALITPGQIVLLRVLFGFAPIFGYALVRRALHWRDLRHAHHFLVMSLLATVLYYYAFAAGTSLLLSSVAGMLSGGIPLFSFVIALIFLREESLNARAVLGVVLGFAGVLLIARPWASDVSQVSVTGVAYMVAGALSLGSSFVYARKYLSPLGISPVALTTYQMGIALLVLLLVTDPHGAGRVFTDTRAATGLILGLGLTGTGIAYILYYFLVNKVGAVAAAGVTYIPPVVALLIGVLLAGEPVDALDIAAAAIILTGVLILQSRRRA